MSREPVIVEVGSIDELIENTEGVSKKIVQAARAEDWSRTTYDILDTMGEIKVEIDGIRGELNPEEALEVFLPAFQDYCRGKAAEAEHPWKNAWREMYSAEGFRNPFTIVQRMAETGAAGYALGAAGPKEAAITGVALEAVSLLTRGRLGQVQRDTYSILADMDIKLKK